jgi:hypothetical protein
MNPDMETHDMYTNRNVKEFERLVVTKFRLSSHSLAIETGRWSRKPREERTCPECRVVQDEPHALADFRLNEEVRAQLPRCDYELPNFFSLETCSMVNVCYRL